jgi:hypothetical protein
MNIEDIDRFVRVACRGIFQGDYSIDTLPETPRLLICNTGPSYKPGQHWVALYVNPPRRGEYVDSFGRRPPAMIEDYMNKHCVKWLFNAKQLQSVASSYCGFYCCFYCVLRCRDVDLTRIVNSFINDTGFNHLIVRNFVCG